MLDDVIALVLLGAVCLVLVGFGFATGARRYDGGAENEEEAEDGEGDDDVEFGVVIVVIILQRLRCDFPRSVAPCRHLF